MNYQRLHDNIVDNAKRQNRSKKTGIYELHHILMKSLGGDDSEENLVLLTPKEHFIVHYLLWKINPNGRKFRDPVFWFKDKGANNSRLYEAARISHIKEMKENNPSLHLSEESKMTKSGKLKAYVKTDKHRANISKAKQGQQTRLGAILSDDSKDKISDSLKKWYENNEVSEETREKLRRASTGRTHSEESLRKQKERALNRIKYQCPHCDKSYDGGNLALHMRKNGYSEDEINLCKMNMKEKI